MKKIYSLLFVILAATPAWSQATYGRISPVGGVTASLGQELTFTYQTVSGASYYWSAYPASTSIPSSAIVFTSGVTSNTVKVKFMQPMTAFLCVVRYKEGTQPAIECISFQVVNCAALPVPATLAGPTAIASCGQYTYTAAAVAGASGYQWSGLVTGDRQTVEPVITLSGSDFKLGSSTLRVKALNECGGSGSFKTRNVTVSGIAAPSSITVPDTVLLASTSPVSLSVAPVARAASYRWSGFVTGPKTSTSPGLSVLPGDFSEGVNTIAVSAIDSCEVVGTSSIAMSIFGLRLGNPVSIEGPSTIAFCGNATFTTQTVPGATQYVWSGLTTAPRITSTPEVVLQYTDFTPGPRALIVTAQDNAGNASSAVTKQVEIPAPPLLPMPTQLPPSANYCSDLAVLGGSYPNATEYVWQTSFGYTQTTVTPNFFVPAVSPIAPGQTFTLSVFARSCVNSPTVSMVMTMPNVVLSPISGSSSISCSSANYSIQPVCNASMYEWRVNGELVGGAGGPAVAINGNNYSIGALNIQVRALVNGGWSAPVSKGISNNCPFGSLQQVMVSPNPANNTFMISEIKGSEEIGDSEIRILFEDGRLIKSYKTSASQLNVEDLSLDPGKYIVEIIRGNQRQIRKLIISR